APAEQQAEATPAEPIETAALTPAQAAETIEAEPEESPIPVPIARPPQPQDERNRTEAREKRTAQTEKSAKKQQVANAARGNADRNARAGDASGRETSKAKTGGGQSGGKASKAGNASASNYPGKVYAKIRRTRQKRAGGRGVAQIRFSISASGGLASIRLASSSGSGAVDSAAIDHIRRSAPFPPPPAGAQRQFVIPVEVRR
ncbi:MAG: TonB family protein, partial [Oricola sp.]|nr:TonB family protein [Oricola sp.]